MKSLRIIFAGTPDFAARHLASLLDSEHEIIAVYTQPDRPAGRGNKLTASPVKMLALEHQLPVYQPENFKSENDQQALATLNADIMIVVAYGLLLPKVVLDIPPLGCINVHGSILPTWRGAAPIQRAVWAGDKETGVTIMQMDEGLDTGDILSIARLNIDEKETSASLYDRLAQLGPTALVECINDIANQAIQGEKQDDAAASYAKKLSKEEARIDWQLPAEQIERCVRAFNPWPVSYFQLGKHTIKVWQADVIESETSQPVGTIVQANKEGIQVATGKNIINLITIQLPGKKAMPAADVLNSRKEWFSIGNTLE